MASAAEHREITRRLVPEVFIRAVVNVEPLRGVADLAAVLCLSKSLLALGLPFTRAEIRVVLVAEMAAHAKAPDSRKKALEAMVAAVTNAFVPKSGADAVCFSVATIARCLACTKQRTDS